MDKKSMNDAVKRNVVLLSKHSEREVSMMPATEAPLPSVEMVKQIVTLVKSIIFPDYFQKRQPDEAIRSYYIGVHMEELLTLPGVGRKTANLILGDIYHVPGSTVVDTHCIRLSNRLGLVDGLKEPEKIERALRQILPPDKSSDFCHRVVLHGRAVCDARKPQCERCCCAPYCKTFLGD